METGLIPKIKNILGDDHILRIDVYHDEIIFYLWETEIPIVYSIGLGLVGFMVSYMRQSDGYAMDKAMMYEVSLVMKAIEDHIDELRSWVE